MLENLVKWEKENGYKSKYVAQKIGITPSEYSRMKHGKKQIPITVAYKLQQEFNIDDVLSLLKNEEAN